MFFKNSYTPKTCIRLIHNTMAHMVRRIMEVIIRNGDITVSGKTFNNRDFLKSLGFKWNPQNKVWSHVDTEKHRTFPRNTRITDVRRFQFMKKTYEDRKVATLKACECLPTDITKDIFNRIRFNKCMCRDNLVCWDCKYSCCEMSTPTFCVCIHATQCPNHGRRCNGSHD